MKIERRETMRATMKPDMYGGKGCNELVPRWWCYCEGDKDGDYDHEAVSLDPRRFPPGTTISVKEPQCPECEGVRGVRFRPTDTIPIFDAKCECGFDWEAWTANEFS